MGGFAGAQVSGAEILRTARKMLRIETKLPEARQRSVHQLVPKCRGPGEHNRPDKVIGGPISRNGPGPVTLGKKPDPQEQRLR